MASVEPDKLLKAFPFGPDDYTRCSFSFDGSKLFVGGPFAFLRVFDANDTRGEVEPQIIEPFDATTEVLSIDCSPAGDVLVADNNGKVSLLEAKEPHALKDLITRCNLSARDARFNRQGTKVAVASEELVVKVIDVRDTTDIQLLEGHTKAVRAVSWHPDGTLLTTSGADGTLRVWDFSNSEPIEIRNLDGIIPVEDVESVTQCSAVWHPQGHYFVAATKAHEIAVIQRDTWSRIGTLSTDGHSTAICALAWSANGNYLASAGKDGFIIVWDSKTRTPVTRTRLEEDAGFVTEIAWQPSPGANALAVVTSNGHLIRWYGVISPDRAHPTDLPRAPAPTRVREASAGPSGAARSVGDRDGDSLFGGVDDEDDWIIDDIGGQDDEERRPAIVASRYEPIRSFNAAPAPRPKGQPSFQPGATAWNEKRRYLAFNDVGVAHAVERDTYQVITVDFHDQGSRRGFHWEDYSNHTMASLGSNGVLTAGGEDIIAYRPYSTWTDGTGEWSMHLPKDEKAVAISMGPKLAIVATDAGYLRFLSAGGLQTHLIDFGREVVAAAIGSEFALVLHRANAFAVDDMSYTVIDIDTFEYVQNGVVPINSETTIRWIGFCDDEMPALFKSNGVLSVLDRCRRPWQARWTPILDTRLIPAPIDVETKISYWPVWATMSSLHYVILKGEEKQPAFPTPLTFTSDFQLPALGLDSQEGQTQERIMRSVVLSTHLRDSAAPEEDEIQAELRAAELAHDKDLLRIIEMACKSDRLEQALEAARLLSSSKTLAAAIKVAEFFGLSGLRERFERLQDREGPAQPEKRESRWMPLYDDRTISGPVKGSSAPRSTVDLLAMPFNVERRARSTTGKPVDPPMTSSRHEQDSGFSEDAEPIVYDDENDMSGLEREDDSPALGKETTVAAATSRNLFAKKNKVIPPPLSASSVGNTPSSSIRVPPTANLKKSDSFFTRVEEQQPKGPRQATLFGSKPAPPVEVKKKGGKKRKSDEPTEPQDEVASKASRQTINDMFARVPSRASVLSNQVVAESGDEEEAEETQMVDSPHSLQPIETDVVIGCLKGFRPRSAHMLEQSCMDPLASLLFPAESSHFGTSPSSSSAGGSFSPPGSAFSLDFSSHSLAASPEDESWEATLDQLIAEDQARKSVSPPAFSQQSWPPPSASLPYSFGSARNADVIHAPSSLTPSYGGMNDLDMGHTSAFDLGLGGVATPDFLFEYAKVPSVGTPTRTASQAACIAPAVLTTSAPVISYTSAFAADNFARTHLPTSATPSALSDFGQESTRTSHSPHTTLYSSTSTVLTPAPSQPLRRFKAKVPAGYAQNAPAISIHEADETGEEAAARTGSKRKAPSKMEELGAHNAVERRYRTKINSYIVSLQSLVPALAHLVDPPDQEQTHRRKSSAFVLSSQPKLPAGTIIDGVAAAGKLSKGAVLEKSLEYVRHLRRERERLQTEREIMHTTLAELVDGSDYILQEVDRRYTQAREKLEERYRAEDLAFEREMEGGGAAPTTAGSRPRKAARTNAKAGKRGRKAVESDGSEDDDDDMHNMDAQTSSSRFHSSPDSLQDGNNSPGPPRAMFAVFAGVSFLGGLGYDVMRAADAQSDAATIAWSPRELVKRAFPTAPTPPEGSPAQGSALLFLGIASIIGWLLYLAWPALEVAVGHHRTLQLRRREAAWQAVNSPAKPGEGELARARRTREALTTLARIPKRTLGSFFAIVWDSTLGLIGIRARGFGSALTDDERTEIALALVRLAELESAKPDGLCCLTQRLYTFVRLHNLSHSPRWPVQSSPALAPARVEATLALVLTSIFGSQASALSRRRRLWNKAVAVPKRKDDDEQVEPWVAAALGADFDEATRSQVRGPICGSLASPSDTLPLLRVAEARCETALLGVWTSLFTSVMQTTYKRRSESIVAAAGADLDARVASIASATVSGSPLYTLSVLTHGMIQFGRGDVAAARKVALRLALEAKDAGPAAGLASVSAFTRLLLGDTVGLFMHSGEPAGPLDTLAAVSVRWLIIRQRATAGEKAQLDRDLHDATRELRMWLAQDVFSREGLADAQLTCVDALERMGRKAAGLQDLEEDDSGFED